MSNCEHIPVLIKHITAEHDRFGRIHSVVEISPIIRNETKISKIHLTELDDLLYTKYKVDEVIELPFIGNIPRFNSSNNHFRDYCYCCNKFLINKYGGLYCPNENCSKTIVARLIYAARKPLLDLPICKETLEDIVLSSDFVNDLPSLLCVDINQLDELFDRTESELIVSALQLRMDRLFGRGCSQEEQLLVQSKFLDALSITGLYNKDRMKIHKELQDRTWCWENLTEVLTDTGFLVKCGIVAQDARVITKHALNRIVELDTLARGF